MTIGGDSSVLLSTIGIWCFLVFKSCFLWNRFSALLTALIANAFGFFCLSVGSCLDFLSSFFFALTPFLWEFNKIKFLTILGIFLANLQLTRMPCLVRLLFIHEIILITHYLLCYLIFLIIILKYLLFLTCVHQYNCNLNLSQFSSEEIIVYFEFLQKTKAF